MSETSEQMTSALSTRSDLYRYQQVRRQTQALCEPLEMEDYGAQSMPEASPAKWHLAHTTWFFEQFILLPHLPDYRVFHAHFDFLFNSYYHSVGPQYSRSARGLLTRPTITQVYHYRRFVDEQMLRLLSHPIDASVRALIDLGINHEQQHQELLLTDLKHLLFQNPLCPVYRTSSLPATSVASAPGWHEYSGGSHFVGAEASASFSFDNETPRHRVYTRAFALCDRLVTNAHYLAFVRTGGYLHPEHWLADGWAMIQSQHWRCPLYWSHSLDTEFTLGGLVTLDPERPVCHLSYYEADAFARWSKARLPTEAEWEFAATREHINGNLLEDAILHPLAATSGPGPHQLFGDVWEWTASAYTGYPGYKAPSGAVGEYNGKFMANQMVLRGGSCVTAQSHIRATYRNFMYPQARWQFSGIRLARDLE